MNDIQAFSIGDERYEISKTGNLLIKTKRAVRRKFVSSEKIKEKEYLELLKNENFTEDFSITFKWLTKIFSERILSYQKVRSIAGFFSFLLGIDLPREVYRRRNCCIHWIESNINRINDFLQTTTITVFFNQSRVVNLTPPYIEPRVPAKKDQLTGESTQNYEVYFPENVLNSEYTQINEFDDYAIEKDSFSSIGIDYSLPNI